LYCAPALAFIHKSFEWKFLLVSRRSVFYCAAARNEQEERERKNASGKAKKLEIKSYKKNCEAKTRFCAAAKSLSALSTPRRFYQLPLALPPILDFSDELWFHGNEINLFIGSTVLS
jgi:hypothetical protein